MKNSDQHKPVVEIRFHRLAAQEFRDARKWYEGRRNEVGAEFRAEVDRAISRIEAQPDRWPKFRDRFRKVRLRRFPYLLYYSIIDPTHVMIFAVVHARRRPGYWIRRTSP